MAWQPIENAPDVPMFGVLFFGRLVFVDQFDQPVTSLRREREMAIRIQSAYWDGEAWAYADSGHDVFETWVEDDDRPTHWMPLPEPPEVM